MSESAWHTDEDGWTTRTVNGRPYFMHCQACDAPVTRTRNDICEWCERED